MRTAKMWSLVIRIKRNDTARGKRVHDLILDILKKGNITGATVWTGVDGYGKRGKSTLHLEGIAVNMPLVIEAIDDLQKLEKILPEIKELVHNNGLITMQEIGVI
jgi:PII-like signaling protein